MSTEFIIMILINEFPTNRGNEIMGVYWDNADTRGSGTVGYRENRGALTMCRE